MEGGGARGNTYLGAIRELEVQLLNRVKAINHENHENGIEKVPKIENTGSNARKPGIMDYWKQDPNDPEKYIPIIEGVAGASAGAITTFALILGLNSDEINTVLKFDFSSFLSEIDAGKYRMIDENSELKIGEDSTLYNEPDTLFETKQKKLGGKKTKFDFDLSNNKTNVTGNPAKFAKRGLLVNFIVKVVVDGIVYNIGQLYRLFSNKEKPNWVVKAMQKIFGTNSSVASETGSSMLTRIVMYSGGLVSLFYIVFRKKKMGMRVNANSIMGVFTDRGMYSGFQIREFFFDIMIFAATRDTFFQKQLIKFYKKDYPNLSHESFKVTNKKVNNKNKSEDFVIGSRGDYNFTTEFKKLIEFHLKNMTFRDFFNILEVDFAAAVSNFTTNSPLYFSNNYTPDFFVLEAVGASMSIPPAIRPLYNASNVFSYYKNTETPQQKALSVFINGKDTPFVKKDGSFIRSDYEWYEYITKKAIQQYVKNKETVNIDLNNVIELNTFLNYMQKILIGERQPDGTIIKDKWKSELIIEANGNNYKVTEEILVFFYNAQFKGLLLDGGYFNNIPFNYFREKGNPLTLDNVLAIKLDRSFPPDFMKDVHTIMEPLKSKEREVIERVRLEEIEIGNIIPLNAIDTSDFNKDFELAVVQIRNLLGAQVLNEKKSTLKRQLKEGDLSDDEKKRLEGIVKNFKVNRQNILKIIEEWYLHYGAYNDVKPWELPRPIIDIAFTGYAYGAKRGQIRDITDHKYIVSLYDYGVGTYDFDLDKVRSLAEFAQREAQNKLNTYFTETNNE
jgi:predicted acylesterase/phospholipase RssA